LHFNRVSMQMDVVDAAPVVGVMAAVVVAAMATTRSTKLVHCSSSNSNRMKNSKEVDSNRASVAPKMVMTLDVVLAAAKV